MGGKSKSSAKPGRNQDCTVVIMERAKKYRSKGMQAILVTSKETVANPSKSVMTANSSSVTAAESVQKETLLQQMGPAVAIPGPAAPAQMSVSICPQMTPMATVLENVPQVHPLARVVGDVLRYKVVVVFVYLSEQPVKMRSVEMKLGHPCSKPQNLAGKVSLVSPCQAAVVFATKLCPIVLLVPVQADESVFRLLVEEVSAPKTAPREAPAPNQVPSVSNFKGVIKSVVLLHW